MSTAAVAMSLPGMDETHYVRKQDKSYGSVLAHCERANNGIQGIDRASGEIQFREQFIREGLHRGETAPVTDIVTGGGAAEVACFHRTRWLPHWRGYGLIPPNVQVAARRRQLRGSPPQILQ